MRTEKRRAPAVLAVLLLFTACRDEAPPEISKGKVVLREGTSARSIVKLVPAECRVGEVFGRQPSGEATLGIIGTGLTRGDTIRWNGRPMKTGYGNSRNLSASIPAEALQTPGKVEVTIQDDDEPSRPKLRAEFSIRASP